MVIENEKHLEQMAYRVFKKEKYTAKASCCGSFFTANPQLYSYGQYHFKIIVTMREYSMY